MGWNNPSWMGWDGITSLERGRDPSHPTRTHALDMEGRGVGGGLQVLLEGFCNENV